MTLLPSEGDGVDPSVGTGFSAGVFGADGVAKVGLGAADAEGATGWSKTGGGAGAAVGVAVASGEGSAAGAGTAEAAGAGACCAFSAREHA